MVEVVQKDTDGCGTEVTAAKTAVSYCLWTVPGPLLMLGCLVGSWDRLPEWDRTGSWTEHENEAVQKRG